MEQTICDEQGNLLGTMEDDFDEQIDWIGEPFAW